MKSFVFCVAVLCVQIVSASGASFCPIKQPFVHEQVVTDPQALLKAAQHMLAYIHKHEHRTPRLIHEGVLAKHGYTIKHVKETLVFIIQTIERDNKTGRQRILDPQFLCKHFDCVRWAGDAVAARKRNVTVPKNKLYWTQYLVPCVPGKYHKTSRFNCALYAVPEDEKGKTLNYIGNHKNKFIRYRYTKHQILAGAIEGNSNVKPLVWLTRKDFEDATMQGTIVAQFPDNKMRAFNAVLHNGIAYDRRKKQLSQQRYFYFNEVKRIKGVAGTLTPGVSLAGDMHNIGLGKIVALRYVNNITQKPEMRLGIIADTGGAFKDNLYQLDFFTGIFRSKKAFQKYIQPFPRMANAYILMKKP